jgi:predicted dehydrogenase
MPQRTRRDFLLESMFAAAATAAAASPISALAGEGGRTTGRKLGPNDQIRIAVLGVRGRGKDHVSNYARMNDVTVAALCDPDLNVVPAAARIVTAQGKPAPAVFQDFRKVLEDPNIDAVSIATPNHWHSLAGIWAMQAGKDVYVEKPVSHNVHEGRVLVDTARKYARVCQAGTQCRSMQGTIDAIAYVHSGKIGRVTLARGLCYKPRPSIGKLAAGTPPQNFDFNLWVGPAPMKAFHQNHLHYNWHWRWDTGNGDLGNQGIHQMDVARWGLGKQALPKSVIGYGGRLGYEDDGETPNTHVAEFDYEDCRLIFETRGLKTDDYRKARIGNVFHGTDGYVVLTSYNGGAAFDNDGKMITQFNGGGDHYRNFIDCMRNRKWEELHGEILEGHLSSALCHLGNISYLLGEPAPLSASPEIMAQSESGLETFERFRQHLTANSVDMSSGSYTLGRRLRIDPRRENFGRDREANRLLTREYRAPFIVPEHA